MVSPIPARETTQFWECRYGCHFFMGQGRIVAITLYYVKMAEMSLRIYSSVIRKFEIVSRSVLFYGDLKD